jgi:hypothetical protein
MKKSKTPRGVAVARNPLRIRVNPELTLDAGIWNVIPDRNGPCRVIEPPESTLFDQIVSYLDEKPPIQFRHRFPKPSGFQ